MTSLVNDGPKFESNEKIKESNKKIEDDMYLESILMKAKLVM
jgi:hypothetical protein